MGNDPGGDLVQLTDAASGAQVWLAPSRGGLVTRFDVGGEPVLFLDGETLRDASKNVRGGVPVLFPSPGKLTGDRWGWGGRRGELTQHGFARNLPWRVVSPAAARSATLRLEIDEALRERWPWPCVLEIEFSLRDTTLRLDQRVTSRATTPMPCGLGFHPYFFVPREQKGRVRLPTAARRAFDNVQKRVVELDPAGIDLSDGEVDLHLVDHGGSEAALVWADGSRVIRLRGSQEYTQWVIWTLADRDFVCLEPWTCPADALNTGDRLMVLAPAATRSLFLEVSLERPA